MYGSPSMIESGVYGPDGPYYYRWNASASVLEFAVPPTKGWATVSLTSTAGRAIYAKIPSIPKLSKSQISALSLGLRAPTNTAPQVTAVQPYQAPSLLPAIPSFPTASPATPIPFYQQDWFPPLAVFLMLGGALMIFSARSN